MQKLWKRAGTALLALALSVSLAVPAMAAETAQPSAGETALKAAMQYGQAESLTYAVWQDGAIADSGHMGNFSRTENRALLDSDLYGIGSVSKMYTTAAVMKLAEQGKVDLDAPVTRYLKSFKMADARYKDITVRMLLNHSSGLMGTSSTNAFLFADDDQEATEDLLTRLSTQYLKADPGAFSAYCNDGFTLAELVVEAVSGKPFMEFVRVNLLKDGATADTYAPQDDFDTTRLPATYSGTDTRALPQDCLGIVGAGGMVASAPALAAFGGSLTGTGILSAKSTAAMAAPEYDRGIWPDEPLGMVSYGLGWDAVEFWPFQQNNIQCLVKGGDTLRYHAALLVLPQYHMAAAVLTSGGVSIYNEMAAAQLLVDALTAKGVKIDQTAPTLPEAAPAAMPATLVENSGYYGTTTQQLSASVTADGKLTLHQISLANVPDQVLTYYSDGSFRDETGSVAAKIVKESNGETYFYQQSYTPLSGLGIYPTSDYLLVKMPENPVSAAAQSAWDALTTVGAVPLAEKYTSQLYLSLSESSAAQSAAEVEYVPGYFGGMQILSETEARYQLAIGRDGSTARLDGDLLWLSGAPYQLDTALKSIYTGSGWAYTTIQADGYARWYTVGDAAGETMTVSLPENAGFYVYDASGVLTASSLLWGDRAVTLPEGGVVVFAGDVDARFHLRFTPGA